MDSQWRPMSQIVYTWHPITVKHFFDVIRGSSPGLYNPWLVYNRQLEPYQPSTTCPRVSRILAAEPLERHAAVNVRTVPVSFRGRISVRPQTRRTILANRDDSARHALAVVLAARRASSPISSWVPHRTCSASLTSIWYHLPAAVPFILSTLKCRCITGSLCVRPTHLLVFV